MEEVDDYERLVLGVGNEGLAFGSRQYRAGVWPGVIFFPRGDGIDLLGDFTGSWVDDVELAVGGKSVSYTLLTLPTN